MTQHLSLSEVKERVKERADLSTYISRHTQLVKTARGFKGCCPLPGHKEKSPSFHVDTSQNYFYCYGCNRGGDIFSFLQLVEGLSFMEALKELAASMNIELPQFKREDPEFATQNKSRLESGFHILERTAKFYYRVLGDQKSVGPKTAWDYLKKRLVTAEEAEKLLLGWSPDDGHTLVSKMDSQEKAIAKELGLIRESARGEYDFFRDRMMIPIFDVKGRVAGFSGRTLREVDGKNPKYINSSESDWFKKKTVLYGLHSAATLIRSENYVCLVEGFFDQWAFARVGIPAVAVMGTALTPEHLAVLGRFTKNVILVLDADQAGIASTKKSLPPLLQAEWDVRVFSGMQGKDPDEWLQSQKQTNQSVRKLLEAAPDGLTWLTRLALKEASDQKLNRIQSLKKFSEAWALCTNKAQKTLLSDELAPFLGLDREAIFGALDDLQDKAVPAVSIARPMNQGYVPQAKPKALPQNTWERAAEEAFVWWLWHWSNLAPLGAEHWQERISLFRGSPAEGCALALFEAFLETKTVPPLSFVSTWMGQAKEDNPIRTWILKGLVPPERIDVIHQESAKILLSFDEMCHRLRKEAGKVEISQLQRDLRGLKFDNEATDKILRRVQELSLSLEKAK